MMNDWGGLRGIIDEAKQLDADEKARPLVDCPICGTVLQTNTRGAASCPLGHFRAPAGATRGQYA